MPEIWDLYDRDGRPTGRTIERGRTPPPGEYHLVVHIWPYDREGRFLIQRRARHLERFPGVWAATGGAVLRGEDSRAGAMRETEEELGVAFEPDAFTLGTRLVRANSLADIWFVRVEDEQRALLAPGLEVEDIRWVRLAEIPGLMTRGAFFDYGSEYIDLVRACRP